MQTEILIIGAGAAGLAAAVELSKAGRRVVVIEARDRIGGRMFTQHTSGSNHPIELGAEFIHGKVDEDEEKTDGDSTFRLLNGYRGIIDCLFEEAEAHGAKFLLNTAASEISWQERRVQTRTTTDLTIVATKGVLTIPLSLLKLDQPSPGAISFVPSLPQKKLDAINALEMGPALRIVLRFNDKFWQTMRLPGDSFQDLKHISFLNYAEAPLPTWWTTLPEDDPMLVGWAGGPTAAQLLKLSEEEIEANAIRSLALILGVDDHELRSYLLRTYFHNWSTDPFSRGAYAYLPVNGIEHQLTLAKPIANTLFFAGEATSLGEIGTVHGAIKSGQRVAREILATDPAQLISP